MTHDLHLPSPHGTLPPGIDVVPRVTIELLRPGDLLALVIEITGVLIDESQASDDDLAHPVPPRITRVEGWPALMFVRFPSQHIAEQPAWDVRFVDPVSTTPLYSPVSAVMAGQSRLVFGIPDDRLPMDLTVEQLLNWSELAPLLAPNAHDVDEVALRSFGPPRGSVTAIEHPYRLFLSPRSDGRWQHLTKTGGLGDYNPYDPGMNEGTVGFRRWRYELWHTRLGRWVGDGDTQVFREVYDPDLKMRAIWAADLDPGRGIPPPATLEADQRIAIARQTSDFALETLATGPAFSPQPLQIDRFVMTSLGASARLHGTWNIPQDLVLRRDLVSDQRVNPVTEWKHIASIGRDLFSLISERGVLYPFGHRVLRTIMVERDLRHNGVLVRTEILALREHERDYAAVRQAYAADGREMPFRRARIENLPDGVVADLPPGSHVGFLKVADEHARVHVQLWDWEGRSVDIEIPVLFVEESELTSYAPMLAPTATPVPSLTVIRNGYEMSGHNVADLAGQSIAFADPNGIPNSTTLAASRVWLTGQTAEAMPAGGYEHVPVGGLKPDRLPAEHPPFLPVLHSADIRVPAVDRLAGSSGAGAAIRMRLHRAYVQAGSQANNPYQVFASLARRAVTIPSDRAGGLIAPNIEIDGLSRTHGAVPMVEHLIAAAATPGVLPAVGPGSTDEIFKELTTMLRGVRLLGTISLVDMLDKIGDELPLPTSPLDLDQLQALIDDTEAQLPKLRVPAILSRTTPTSIETHLFWTPALHDFGCLTFTGPSARTTEHGVPQNPEPPLVLHTRMVARADLAGAAHGDGVDAHAVMTVDGRLRNFQLSFFGAVIVKFKELAFTGEVGKGMQLRATGVDLELAGELQFVETFQQYLPTTGFAEGARITLTPTGVTAGYTLAIPKISLGVISIENLVLSARLILPFTDEPTRFRFALSEREHPFTVTVAMFGGAGFFALEVPTDGPMSIEAAIEFGGSFSLDIGVASGGAHLMAGIYIRIVGEDVTLSGYVRCGGYLEVLGLISISVEFYLALTYESKRKVLYGQASVTVGVSVLMFHADVELTVSREFAGADPPFRALVEPSDWDTYCAAFA